jgi:tetratricopeptide (TPR) repeat protein
MIEHATSPLGLYGTGLVLERQGQTFDALGAYLKANKYERTFSPALMSMGRVFRNLGEYDLAAAAYLECSGLPDSPGVAIANYAIVRCDDHQTAAAFGALKAADTTGTDKTMTQLIRARAHAQRMQFDSAETAYSSVGSRIGKSPFLMQLAADYLEDRGLPDSAVRVSAAAVAKAGSRDFDLQYTHFRRCLRLGYLWQARQSIDQLSGGDTTGLPHLSLQIQYGLSAGDTYHASRAKDKFLREGNNSLTSYAYDADVCMKVGDYPSVTQDAGLITSLSMEGDDTTAFSRYLIGMVLLRYAKTNEPAELAAELAKTSGWAADRREYRLEYLNQLFKLGASEVYELTLTTMGEVHGKHPDWLSGIGDLWADRSLRNYDEAESYFRRALAIDSSYWPAVRDFTKACMDAGNHERALAFFDAYPQIVSAHPELALDRAYCLAFAGQVEQGSSAFQAALPKARGGIGRVEAMSRLLEAKDRIDLDGSLIRLLLLLDEKNPDALLLAAKRDNDYGNYQSALETAERGLAIEPTSVVLQVQKARALFGKGDKETAKAQLTALAKANSGNVEVNLYLSAMMAADKDNLPFAQNFARGAHFWETGSRRTVNNMAYVYLQSDRPDLAAGDIWSVASLHPDWGDTQYLYGVALYLQGKTAEAKPYLQKAVELGVPTVYREKAKELLSKL